MTLKIDCMTARKLVESIVKQLYEACFDLGNLIKPASFFSEHLSKDYDELHHLIVNHLWGLIRKNLITLGQRIADYRAFQHVIDVKSIVLYVDLLQEHATFCHHTLLYWVPLLCDHRCPHYEPSRLASPEGVSDPDSDPDCPEPDDLDYDAQACASWEFPDAEFLSTAFLRRWHEVVQLLNTNWSQIGTATNSSTKFDFADWEVFYDNWRQIQIYIDRNSDYAHCSDMEFLTTTTYKLLQMLIFYGKPRPAEYFARFHPHYLDTKFDHHPKKCLGCSMHLEHCWKTENTCAADHISDCVVHALKLSVHETMSMKQYFWWSRLLAWGYNIESVSYLLNIPFSSKELIQNQIEQTRKAIDQAFIVPPMVSFHHGMFPPQAFDVRPLNLDLIISNLCKLETVLKFKQPLRMILALALSGQLKMARYFSTLSEVLQKHYADNMPARCNDENEEVEAPIVTLILNGIFNKFRTGQSYELIPELRKVKELLMPNFHGTDNVTNILSFFEELNLYEGEAVPSYSK